MIGAPQDDLGKMPVPMFLQVQNHVRLDDSGVVQMYLTQFVYHVLVQCLGYHEVSAIHSNRNVHVCGLHGFLSVFGGHAPFWPRRVSRFLLWVYSQLHLEALPEIHPAGHRIVDQKLFGAVCLHAALENQIGPIHDR